MSKPGIVDPWRKAPPKPPEKKGRIEEPTPDSEPVERAVVFEGRGAGVNVWVDASDESPTDTARDRVKALLKELYALNLPEVTRGLDKHGVRAWFDKEGGISAADVSMAVRNALVVSPQAATVIAKYKVKAFVK